MRTEFFHKITDGTVSIRELELKDLDDYFELLSNKNVCRFMGFEEYSDPEIVKKLLIKLQSDYADGLIFQLGIEFSENRKIIGFIGLSKYDLTPTTAQVIYALSEQYWHQGLMARALGLFADYLFKIQKKEILIATHVAENVNSGKVMLKAGFVRDPNYDRTMMIKGINRQLIGYSLRNKGE